MNNLNCDIIKDLIPSYLDEICSESSKKAVDEHLLKCEKCRTYMETLKTTEIIAEGINQDELDRMKKVKRYYTQKNVVGAALLFILSLAVLLLVPKFNFVKDFQLYCAIFSILTLGTFLLLNNYETAPRMNARRILMGAVGILGILYCVGIIALMNHTLKTNTGPLGLELNRTGPFFSRQLIAIFILELSLFILFAIDAVKGKHHMGIFPSWNLVGCTLCLSYNSFLYHMDSPEILFINIEKATLLVLSAGIGIAAVELIIMKLHTAFSSPRPDRAGRGN